MADRISSENRSKNMAAIRSKDTKPEITVRKTAHKLGYRFRLHRKDLAGKPDLVFPARRKVIFVHGCFWHQHTDANCLDGRLPKSNTDYWNEKLRKNIERDKRNQQSLKESGWRVLVIWECETSDMDKLTSKLDNFLTF